MQSWCAKLAWFAQYNDRLTSWLEWIRKQMYCNGARGAYLGKKCKQEEKYISNKASNLTEVADWTVGFECRLKILLLCTHFAVLWKLNRPIALQVKNNCPGLGIDGISEARTTQRPTNRYPHASPHTLALTHTSMWRWMRTSMRARYFVYCERRSAQVLSSLDLNHYSHW